MPAPSAQSGLPLFDVEVCWGERKAISDNVPAGEIVAQFILDNGRGYILADAGSGYTLWLHQTGEFQIDYDLRSVRGHLSPQVRGDIAGLIVLGNVIACVPTLARESVVHASAVVIGGSALAFLGSSGMGKSSLAAFLSANCARFGDVPDQECP